MNLLNFFPMPRYLRIPTAGIDISDRSIKYAELEKRNDGGLFLKKFGKTDIEEGVMTSGEIKNKEALIKCLKKIRQEVGNNYIVASLPEEKAFLKAVHLPAMEPDRVRESLAMQLEEIIPFLPQEVSFDFELVKSSGANRTEVVLSAFPRKIVEDYAFVFEEAGFTPVAFELENQSIFRSLVGSEQKDAVMIVDFGRTRTSFLVGEKKTVEFGSTVTVAGEDINRALAKELNKSIFEAEKLKKKQVIFRGEKQETFNALLHVVSVLKDEMRKIIDYWNNQLQKQGLADSQIGEIILCGGDSNIGGLVDYLSYSLKKRVRMGNVWTNITLPEDYVPEMEKRESFAYATTLGLALIPFSLK